MTWKKADRFRQRKSWNASLTIWTALWTICWGGQTTGGQPLTGLTGRGFSPGGMWGRQSAVRLPRIFNRPELVIIEIRPDA